MRYILFRMKRFCGFAVGFVYFISGLLKLVDPVGAGLVMKEYFKFLHLGFLEGLSLPSGVTFALAETIVGAGLITGVWRKIIAAAAVGLQSMFTILTLLLVIFKPEMDCGCFGEAIHLTHGETFIKNIILLSLLLIYFIPIKYLGQTRKKKYVSFALVSLSSIAFTIYSLMYIPMADFTDFRPGAVVNNESNMDEAAFEATFVYSKDGKEERFSLENLPDSTWTFVRADTSPVTEDGQGSARISIYDNAGNYADSLITKGKVMIVSLYKGSLSEKDIRTIREFLDNAKTAGFSPILLTSGVETHGLESYNCDYKTLITLNRSNGGATYLEDGYIIRKWAERTLPAPGELAMISDEDPTDTFIGRDTRTSLAFQGFLLYVFAVMLLL
ncbi:MAG: hypothetical protein E7116_03005 [Bacteroidales bacterium]|nr:hypothetical protein [Bacteroidales bacterium]